MALALSALLTHQLATDEAASSSLALSRSLQLLQTHRWIAAAQEEAAITADVAASERISSILHRWQLRITSLVNSKVSAATQAAGYQLALETSRQSQSLFVQHSKAWYNAALALLSRKSQGANEATQPATKLLLFCFEQAAHSQEYAREVANAAGVRKLGDALLLFAGSEANDLATRLFSLDALCKLVRISASPLRPLAQQMQSLAAILLCQWAEPDASLPEGQKAAAKLLGSVYITAGKAQAGNAWRKTVEGFLGAAHQLVTPLVSTLVEEVGPASGLAALELPPLIGQPSSSLDRSQAMYPALQRLDALISALISMLGAVTERAVPIPIGALVGLAERLLTLSIHSPSKERQDAALHAAQLSLLPQLHILGCKLTARLSKILGSHMSTYSTRILGHLSFVLGTYTGGSPTRCSPVACAAVIATSTHVHPDEGSKHLSKIVRGILEDAAILADPEEGRKAAPKAAANGTAGGERKTKRMKMYDTVEEGLDGARRRLDQLEVACIRSELASLHSILASSSWLLSPSILNLVLRYLLAVTLDSSFFSHSASATLLGSALSLAPTLRSTSLSCLVAALRSSSARDAPGSLDLAAQVFRQGKSSNACSSGEKAICQEGLDVLDATLRPNVPPLLRTRGMRLGMLELAGGPVDQRTKAQAADEQQAEAAQATENGRSLPLSTTEGTQPTNGLVQTAAKSPVPPQQPLPTAQPAAMPAAPIVEAATIPSVAAAKPPLAAEQPAQPKPAPEVAQASLEVAHAASTQLSTAAMLIEGDVSMGVEEEIAEQPETAERSASPVPSTSRRPASPEARQAQDSDSDDDAPMPRIVMSDSE